MNDIMDCDDFSQRMHECLDEHRLPEHDQQLSHHAMACESCRSELLAWQQIVVVLPKVNQRGPSEADFDTRAPSVIPALGLAAALLISVTTYFYSAFTDGAASSEMSMALAAPSEQESLVVATEMDPTHWWNGVQNRDWIGESMPAVESLRDGVAPIGRTLMRAVTILTIGGNDQTS